MRHSLLCETPGNAEEVKLRMKSSAASPCMVQQLGPTHLAPAHAFDSLIGRSVILSLLAGRVTSPSRSMHARQSEGQNEVPQENTFNG